MARFCTLSLVVTWCAHCVTATGLTRSRTASFWEHDPTRLNHHSSSDVAAAIEDNNSVMDNEAGRAEACGTLCRILCSHKTDEEILPVYLSSFYLALYYGLEVNPVRRDSWKHLSPVEAVRECIVDTVSCVQDVSGQVMANIILNSSDLLRVNLNGVTILLPRLFKAINAILSESTPKIKWALLFLNIFYFIYLFIFFFFLASPCIPGMTTSFLGCSLGISDDFFQLCCVWSCRCYDMVPTVELRRAAIHLLLSMLCLPLHFKTLTINRKLLWGLANEIFLSQKICAVAMKSRCSSDFRASYF